MSIFHCSIKIISRSGGRSAVASAAYRAGEELTNEETGLVHNFKNKKEVVYSEILLPPNAPERLADRSILWNEVQSIEKRSNAQLAREVEVALPLELSREEQIKCVHDYVVKNFQDEGMIVDWSLHEKEGNPHAHILLTVRGFNEEHKWNVKKKNYWCNDIDENGRAIYNPDKPSYDPKRRDETAQYRIPKLDNNGEQKKKIRQGKGVELLWEKVDVSINDWNERDNAEKWRVSWAEECNKYLAPEKQIDHRSFARQGIELIPTVHEGAVARKIESKGGISDRKEINRKIRIQNSLLKDIIDNLNAITMELIRKGKDIYERYRESRRDIGYVEAAERIDSCDGRNAERYREQEYANNRIGGTTERVNGIKRAIEQTEQFITETDRRIAKIKSSIRRVVDERDARIKRLMERRRTAYRDGEATDRDRNSSGGKTEDIIRELNAAIGFAERKCENSRASRDNREAERERYINSEKQKARIELERAARRTSKKRGYDREER